MRRSFRVVLTMRVEMAGEYAEERDAISHDWINYLRDKEWEINLLPNGFRDVAAFLDSVKPDGIILTGGNDIGPTGNHERPSPSVSLKRDQTEKRVLDFAVAKVCPVLGVCRGMQFINVYFGGRIDRDLFAATDHARGGGAHPVDLLHPVFQEWCGNTTTITNSYHNQGITAPSLASNLIAAAKNGAVIEAIIHRSLPLVGVQWHPERALSSGPLDDRLFAAMVDGFESLRTE